VVFLLLIGLPQAGAVVGAVGRWLVGLLGGDSSWLGDAYFLFRFWTS
jgi:hypothetical protein